MMSSLRFFRYTKDVYFLSSGFSTPWNKITASPNYSTMLKEPEKRAAEHGILPPLFLSTSGSMGPIATMVYRRFAFIIAEKQQQFYSWILFWLRCKMSFSLQKLIHHVPQRCTFHSQAEPGVHDGRIPLTWPVLKVASHFPVVSTRYPCISSRLKPFVFAFHCAEKTFVQRFVSSHIPPQARPSVMGEHHWPDLLWSSNPTSLLFAYAILVSLRVLPSAVAVIKMFPFRLRSTPFPFAFNAVCAAFRFFAHSALHSQQDHPRDGRTPLTWPALRVRSHCPVVSAR